MANRKNKSTTDQDEKEQSKAGDWWKTPAIFAAILALIGTIITTLPALIKAVQEAKPVPTPTVVATETNSLLPPPDFCNDFFAGDVIELQTGVPKSITFDGKEVINVKLMNGSTLLGGMKFIIVSKTVLTADQTCAQIKPPFNIEAGLENDIEYGQFVLRITYDETKQLLDLKLN